MAGTIKQISLLFAKDFYLLYKDKGASGGIILFLVSSIFIAYHALGKTTDTSVINAIFWIILVFSLTTAVTAVFSKESRNRDLYYYNIVSPLAYVFAKILLNLTTSTILSLSAWLLFMFFFGIVYNNTLLFIAGLLIGSSGFTLVLTLASALASRSGGSFTLAAILSFPLLIPVLIMADKITMMSLQPEYLFDLALIIQAFALNIVITLLIIMLFPYLWKE